MSAEDDEPEVVDSDNLDMDAGAARDEPVETRSAEARRKLREQMQADIERFLRSGGHIEQVAPNLRGNEANAVSVGDLP